MQYKRVVSYSYTLPGEGSVIGTHGYKSNEYILMVLHGLFDYD